MSASAFIDKMLRRDEISELEQAVLRGLLSPPRVHRAGSHIVRPGDRPEESTLMLAGFCGRYTTIQSGKLQITQLHIAGDFIDLHSFVMKQMDHGVLALTDCTVSTVSHAALIQVSEREPHLTRLLWLETVVDAAMHRQLLASVGLQNAHARLAHLFCEMLMRLQAADLASGTRFPMPLSQSRIGEVLSLSPVQVNRSAMYLRSRGLIRWSRQEVEILDFPALAALGEFDPAYLRLHREPV